jgi:hypothetical protein
VKVEPFLKDAVGEWQDKGRDAVPSGYAWSMRDFIPARAGAPIRGRGSWYYSGAAFAASPDALGWAPFAGGAKLVSASGTQAHDIPVTGTGATLIGTIAQMAQQYPIFYRDRLYLPSMNNNCRYLTYIAGVWAVANIGAAHVQGRYGTVYRDRLVLGRTDTFPTRVGFAKPGDPTVAWDTLSYIDTTNVLSGLQAMRNQILCFHSDYVEQIRGTIPPDSTLSDIAGDMQLGVMWDRAGCFDGRSIAGWQENVIFADERGVHITDGGLVRNMIERGGMSKPWREQFLTAVEAISGAVFGNTYICTVRFTGGVLPPVTWCCDIPTRRWYRWGNIDSSAFAVSSGAVERLFATHHSNKRVVNMERCFDPPVDLGNQQDGNGTNVLAQIETAWQRLSRRVGMRRIFDIFVHYLGYQAVDPGGSMVTVSVLEHAEGTVADYVSLDEGLRQSVASVRRKIPVYRRFEGIAFRVNAAQPMVDFRLFSLGVSMEEEEEHRI